MAARRSDSFYFHCGGAARVNICLGVGGYGWGLFVLVHWVLGQRGLDTGLPQGGGVVLSAISYRSAVV